ncbi:MAG: hypothetical protein HY902_20680 [Deltaproteobacteria bacterium]|nr:hypothetical protein [Deltaproteobacteria bacterium]
MSKLNQYKTMLLALLLVTQVGCAGLIARLAKFAAPTVPATASLTDVVVTAGVESNLPTADLGTMAQSFFDGWKTGGDMVFLMFTKKGSSGFLRIDGTVTVDGKPADYLAVGSYSAIFDASSAPRKVEIATTSGEKASFLVEPNTTRFKLKTINGQPASGTSRNVAIDLTKDVVVELDGAAVPAGTMVKIALAINQVGIKSIYDVCYVRYAPTVTIPAAAFRNINIKPGGSLLYNYSDSFLAVGVETSQDAKDLVGLPPFPYITAYSDGALVKVTADPELNKGLMVEGSDANMDYQVYKPSAFLSRPSEHVKKFGVLSLSIRGTTFHQTSETTRSSTTLNMGGISNKTTTTTTKTTTLQFPAQPDAAWDALMEELYPEFVAVLKAEFGAEEVGVDAITATEAYKHTAAFAKDDSNTKVQFARSFRKTKVVSAFMPVAEGFGSTGVNARIMNETGTDALVTLTLDLEISASSDEKILMIPRLAFEVTGKPNGLQTSTKYLVGRISSTTGVPFAANIGPAGLKTIVRKSDLMAVFSKTLKEIRRKEQANGDYLTVWNLQK